MIIKYNKYIKENWDEFYEFEDEDIDDSEFRVGDIVRNSNSPYINYATIIEINGNKLRMKSTLSDGYNISMAELREWLDDKLVYIERKSNESFNDPYGEEDWYEDLIVNNDTIMNIGDKIYDWNNMYCGKIERIEGDKYYLDNGKIADKWQLVQHKFKKNINESFNESLKEPDPNDYKQSCDYYFALSRYYRELEKGWEKEKLEREKEKNRKKIDPFGEEIWENLDHNELDPFGEEDWYDENEFQIGDIVICIDDEYVQKYMKKDHEYEIENINNDRIKIKGNPIHWLKSRFKKKNINESFNESFDHEDIDPYGEEDWYEDEEFKIGDIVICHDNHRSENYLEKNKEYEIIDIERDDEDILLKLKNIPYRWMSNRFKKKRINESFHEDIDPYGEEEWGDEGDNEFRIGDTVICQIPDDGLLHKNREYEIEDIDDEGYDIFLKLKNVKHYWVSIRFKKKR